MSRLLPADLYRMFTKKWFWLSALFMFIISLLFIFMQYTAMDYTVSIDRVIFLPMSFYGILTAAFVSLFVGEDFSDGVIKNKIISGRSRTAVYFSNLIAGCTGCVAIYLLMLAITWGIGIHFFEKNVSTGEIVNFVLLGILTCLVYGSFFCLFTMLAGNRTIAVTLCMIVAFAFLFLSLNSNQMIMQEKIKDGVLNPHYVSGIKRVLYEVLHDLNPGGQAAQLSMMKCLNRIRFVLVDLAWVLVNNILGVVIFGHKDIV